VNAAVLTMPNRDDPLKPPMSVRNWSSSSAVPWSLSPGEGALVVLSIGLMASLRVRTAASQAGIEDAVNVAGGARRYLALKGQVELVDVGRVDLLKLVFAQCRQNVGAQ
jgi:hypothetical protein